MSKRECWWIISVKEIESEEGFGGVYWYEVFEYYIWFFIDWDS